MEACVRGFSFMAEKELPKVEVIDLQYIEGGELARAWKSTRRERQKQQERKIWNNFVEEQDLIKTVYDDDPYQFVEQLPESCLQEMMEAQLRKMRDEQIEEVIEQNQAACDEEDTTREDGTAHAPVSREHAVTFAEITCDSDDREDADFFHIFDDKDEVSGAEDEINSLSPPTVREKDEDKELSTVAAPQSDKCSGNNSAENVSYVIESSIYCAKVRDLRIKINEELENIILSLETQDLGKYESEELSKMCKRSTEFCARFHRIYVYQLQRQLQDIKRNNGAALPFAKHTQFQSQMVRVVSLHQNMLHSLQVFHKSFEQTGCVRPSGVMLRSLLALQSAASAECAEVLAPQELTAIKDLYSDNVLSTCEKVTEAIDFYESKISHIIGEKPGSERSKKSRKNGKKLMSRNPLARTKSGTKPGSEAKLSMYSFDTLRINLHSKSNSSNNQSSGTSKMRVKVVNSTRTDIISPGPKKSPRHRRPLMRDPHAGLPRTKRAPRDKDTDILTMVEAVDCTSSHMSQEGTPTPSARRGKLATPRRKRISPRHDNSPSHRRKQDTSPRHLRIKPPSPKNRIRRKSPNLLESNQSLKVAWSNMSEPNDTIESFQFQLTPVSKIQCAEKERNVSPKPKLEIPKMPGAGTLKTLNDSSRPKNDITKPVVKKLPQINATSSKANSERTGSFETPRSSRNEFKMSPIKVANGTPKKSPQDGAVLSHKKSEREKEKQQMPDMGPTCDVSKLLRTLCGGDVTGNERVYGAKNAQLVCMSGGSPRQPSTPQLLRILEETIQKKVPKPLFGSKPLPARDIEKLRLNFNLPASTADALFAYRTSFVQHMLSSNMYANSAVGRPWEMLARVSEELIDELLLGCAKEMELRDVMESLYRCETR